MTDKEQWIDEPEEDFHPAKSGDNPIWLGGMKYVPADELETLCAENARLRNALEAISHGLGMFGISAEEDLMWAMRQAGAALETKKAPDNDAEGQ